MNASADPKVSASAKQKLADINVDLRARVLLLVEDRPGDADYVRELLERGATDHYQIVDACTLQSALDRLQTTEVDVVILDLGLPDSVGVDTVVRVRRHFEQCDKHLPIVVLTGIDDDQLATRCIHAGAQDCLRKSEIDPRNLQRAIGYAVSRVRETQLRQLRQSMSRYEQLSTATQGTSVTAAMAGSGALMLRERDRFDHIVGSYLKMLDPADKNSPETSRMAKEQVITEIGEGSGGPRDLLDVHIAALERVVAFNDHSPTKLIVLEARLLALEMMGLLVDYYRTGYRRRFSKDS